jgi:uncharacterized protein (TIGR03118 family)
MKRSLLIVCSLAVAACSQDPAAMMSSDSTAAQRAAAAAVKADKAGYDENVLVSDEHSLHGAIIDNDLVNPWGLAFSPNGILWVSNNGTGTSTLYNIDGVRQSLVVTIPGTGGESGVPTGVVFNPTADFVIPSSTAAKFIFAGEDGTIAAWASGTTAVTVSDRSSTGAVYKGIAIATNGGANFLYVSDFRNNAVDVFDASFTMVNSFTDPGIPSGYGPFGVHTIDGNLYVTYAKQLAPDNHDDEAGVGNGFVDIFSPAGSLIKRFASNGSLNSPWAVVQAPVGFGPQAGDILIGNFGDGMIGAYDANGNFIDWVKGKDHKPLQIDGLWDLTFGPGAAAGTLYFSAGPDDESHGMLGTLTPK